MRPIVLGNFFLTRRVIMPAREDEPRLVRRGQRADFFAFADDCVVNGSSARRVERYGNAPPRINGSVFVKRDFRRFFARKIRV